MPQCDYCDREFDTNHSVATHRGQMHADELPWKNAETLRELYTEKGLSTNELGERWGVNPSTVGDGLRENGIERRGKFEGPYYKNRYGVSQPVRFYTDKRGYERWGLSVDDVGTVISVHRILAVAEWGTDALEGKVVHHKNGVPWDNRVENLELMEVSEHTAHHMENRRKKMLVDDTGTITGWEYE